MRKNTRIILDKGEKILIERDGNTCQVFENTSDCDYDISIIDDNKEMFYISLFENDERMEEFYHLDLDRECSHGNVFISQDQKIRISIIEVK